jgi:hypothetical protein
MHVRIAWYDIGRIYHTISSTPTTTARRDLLGLLCMLLCFLNVARIGDVKKLVCDVLSGCVAVDDVDRETREVLNGLYIQMSFAWLNTSTT